MTRAGKKTNALISAKTREIEELKKSKRASYTYIRVSKVNVAILKQISDKLKSVYAKEMKELRIKEITRDDVITELLLNTQENYEIANESFDLDSNYFELVELNMKNNGAKGV